ncbi:MAG: helix-turn-helix transcriptional regulator [Candidatus Paceibacterota bacterium]|jgi:transcriptional regulator with XRE-family HTH domain
MNNSLVIENRIWKYRKIKKLKQKELAFLIGQDLPSQVSRYERGLALPNSEHLIKLCYALDTKIELLYPHLMKKWSQEVESNKRQSIKSYYSLYG